MEKTALYNFFGKVSGCDFSIEYWDGTCENYGESKPAFKIILRDKISAVKLLRDPSLAIGEAYMDGLIDFEGNLQQIVEATYKINVIGNERFSGLRKSLTRVNRSTSLANQRKDVTYHYCTASRVRWRSRATGGSANTFFREATFLQFES